MYFIYILYSAAADKYYVGYSDDPIRSLGEHNSKPYNTYTSKFRPWILAASFQVGQDRGEAVRIERYIKRQKSRKFIENLIQNQQSPEHFDQMVRIPTGRD
jgi:putative endonuclease